MLVTWSFAAAGSLGAWQNATHIDPHPRRARWTRGLSETGHSLYTTQAGCRAGCRAAGPALPRRPGLSRGTQTPPAGEPRSVQIG